MLTWLLIRAQQVIPVLQVSMVLPLRCKLAIMEWNAQQDQLQASLVMLDPTNHLKDSHHAIRAKQVITANSAMM